MARGRALPALIARSPRQARPQDVPPANASTALKCRRPTIDDSVAQVRRLSGQMPARKPTGYRAPWRRRWSSHKPRSTTVMRSTPSDGRSRLRQCSLNGWDSLGLSTGGEHATTGGHEGGVILDLNGSRSVILEAHLVVFRAAAPS